MYDIVTDIMEKVQKGNVAVFKISGKVRVLPVNGKKRLESMYVDHIRDLVGVYSKDITVKQLKEDLE